jgi:hypothetical protein
MLGLSFRRSVRRKMQKPTSASIGNQEGIYTAIKTLRQYKS